MKKQGHINRELAKILARMGHGQKLVIADAGLPIPPHALCIDLSVQPDDPGLVPVLQSILDDLWVESAYFAQEGRDQEVVQAAEQALRGSQVDRVDWISHEALKAHCQDALAIVRTGQCTPYANVVLVAGVAF